MISNNVVNLIINHNEPHIWRWFIQPIKMVIIFGDGLVEILGEASQKNGRRVFFGDFRIHQKLGS
jgi:hypothetical protein